MQHLSIEYVYNEQVSKVFLAAEDILKIHNSVIKSSKSPSVGAPPPNPIASGPQIRISFPMTKDLPSDLFLPPPPYPHFIFHD